MQCIEKYGARLNHDFGQSEANFPEAKLEKCFVYTSYLDKCDAIINLCKLKSHGMMGMSCAVKNMFGTIPGTVKPEYHYRFPDHGDFANMLVDINEYFRMKSKLRLCICDAVIGMEGNGPTAGTPREIGALLASESPYLLDLAAADIIGLKRENVPTIEAAYRRGLCPSDVSDVDICGELSECHINDYQNIITHTSLEFRDEYGSLVGKVLGGLLKSKPKAKKKACVGCGICAGICPAKAIEIKDGYAVIDRAKCIRCFCCQEFCPKGAMKVKRTLIAKIVEKNKIKNNIIEKEVHRNENHRLQELSGDVRTGSRYCCRTGKE